MKTTKDTRGIRLEDSDDLAADITKATIKIWVAERTVKISDAVLLVERLRTLIDAARTQQQNLR
jgi:hypothetical protein